VTYWLWIAAAVLLLAAAAGVWVAFQRPGFVAGLSSIAARAIWNALAPPLFKRKSPEEEAIDHDYARRGQERPTKHRPHPGEGGKH
jgi:hypothetical protein